MKNDVELGLFAAFRTAARMQDIVSRMLARPVFCFGQFKKVPDFIGERDGTRTHDHLIKSQVLYQLSYALVARHMILAENRFSPFGTRRRGSV